MSAESIMAIAALGMFAVMAAAWRTARVSGNGGWIDVYWSFGTGALGAAFALAGADAVGPVAWRCIAVAALIAVWGARLGAYLLARTGGRHEDARYAELRRSWGERHAARLFAFAMVQAVASILLAFEVRLAALRQGGTWPALDAAGIAIFVVAVLGESMADRQLAAFKSDPANRGRICDVGLWAWSRHPNYFFEWLIWVGFACLAVDPGAVGWSWLALLGPLFMLWLLLRVSGIPPLERHMLASRGDAFRDYRARTSAFVPLPPRRAPGAS